MPESWTFAVARDDLTESLIDRRAMRDPAAGEVLLRPERVGVTANNVTYAVLGDSMRYWEFFPAADRGLDRRWGVVPVWGFGQVVASTVDGVPVGQRVYGYLPSAGHLIVRPGRVDERGFRDESPHRASLPSPYNSYVSTTGDAVYHPDDEDLLVLFRPLFYTSYMLADQIEDNGFYGADVIVISSASSKTAYSAAFELHGKGPQVIGLTSTGNVAFTRKLGCYDEVLAYEQLAELDPARATVYLDIAGRPELRTSLRAHLRERLVRDIAVGLTNQIPNMGDAGDFFFAPNQIRKRTADWGRHGLDERFGQAWRRFAATVRGWVDVVESQGPDGLRQAWLDMLAGRTPPRVGQVVTFP